MSAKFPRGGGANPFSAIRLYILFVFIFLVLPMEVKLLYKSHGDQWALMRENLSSVFANNKGADRVCARIYFSFATIFANQIFFVPFSLT